MKLPKFAITGSSIVNVVGVAVIVYLLVVLGQTVKRNYGMGHEINNLKSQITSLEDQKDQLAYSIQYYKTDSFRDREARSKLGLQLPGENAIIIPSSNAKSVPVDLGESAPTGPQSNLQQWFDFLSGRK